MNNKITREKFFHDLRHRYRLGDSDALVLQSTLLLLHSGMHAHGVARTCEEFEVGFDFELENIETEIQYFLDLHAAQTLTPVLHAAS